MYRLVGELRIYEIKQFVRIAELLIAAVFEVDDYYMVVVHALLTQPVGLYMRQEKRLAATPHPGEDFYHAIVLAVN